MNSLHQAALQRSLKDPGGSWAKELKTDPQRLVQRKDGSLGSYRPASVLPNPSRGIKFPAGEGGGEATLQLDTKFRRIHIL